MTRKSGTSHKLLCSNYSFFIFSISQGISNLGDAFQFIAITTLLVNISGNGLSAGFAIVSTPICSLFLSPFAGSLGDRFNEKYVLIFLDVFRGLIAILFVLSEEIWSIYCLMLLLSSIEILYNPSRKKLISCLLKNKEFMIGNSIISGISGLTFVIGPLLAGFIINFLGIKTIFYINSLTFFMSALLIIFIKTNKKYIFFKTKGKKTKEKIYEGIITGFTYFNNTPRIKFLVFMGTALALGTASVNMTFYSFAFDFLKVSSKSWGIMMSVFYGARLIAMSLSLLFSGQINRRITTSMYICFLSVAIIWFCYGNINNLILIVVLQFLEGTALGLVEILLNSQLQIVSQEDYMARVISINDVINNFGKLFGSLYTYIFIQILSSQSIFILNSMLILVYIIYLFVSTNLSLTKNR